MVTALALILALSDVLLAVVAFLWLLRPESAVGIVARFSGQFEALQRGELSEHDQERLLWAARVARLPLIAVLFLWSFTVGVVLVWVRA